MLRALVLLLTRMFNALARAASRRISPGYQLLIPYATYAPWLRDHAFSTVYERVRRISLVNRFQCWELWQLVEDTAAIDGDVIEIGVYRGASAAIMASKLRLLGSSSRLFCCDTFSGVVKPSDRDNHYRGGEHADTSLASVERLFGDLGLSKVTILAGIFPDHTGASVADRTFRLCHVDVDVYESARAALEWIWPRTSVGGVVVFNDYGYPRTGGITRLVEEQRGRAGRFVIHNLNGSGIVVKTASVAHDD